MRILVLQLCRMGDVLQTTPMLRGLRRCHPDADVTLVLEDRFKDVPVPTTLYDRLLSFPDPALVARVKDGDWRGSLDEVRAFVRELGDEPFDLVINLSHHDLSGLLCALVNAKEIRGGLIASDRTRVVRGAWMTYFWASQTSRAQGCFNLVDIQNWAAGVPSTGGLEIAVSEAAHAWAERWLAAQRIADRPIVALQLGASEDRKRWPPEQFAETVNRLSVEFGDVVLVGTSSERPLVERAASVLRRAVRDAVGVTSLPQLAALLARCRLLLTNDTGTMHVAAAVGTKVVDVSTGPVFVHETGPYGAGHLALEPEIACFPCAAGSQCHHLFCREAFTPDDVAGVVRYALGAGPLPDLRTARVLEAAFVAGRVEYRMLGSRPTPMAETLRRASGRVWRETLPAPVGCEATNASQAGSGPIDLRQPFGEPLAALVRDAEHVGALARRVQASPASAGTLMEAVDTGLRRLLLLGEVEPVCQPFVAFLKTSLDSIAERDVPRIAARYARECDAAATRARRLAELLAA